ncbi:MAG: hypothetical protein SGJ18_13995 [Pseudomonadota bacterium]|nr:hypothetical protein [Pseudomonadota bacterium]
MRNFIIMCVLVTSSVSWGSSLNPHYACFSEGTQCRLFFSILTSHTSSLGWCKEGAARFTVLQGKKVLLSSDTSWNDCSKLGLRSALETEKYIVRFRKNDAHAWLEIKNSQQPIEFQCIQR